jgi:hypothetical protein
MKMEIIVLAGMKKALRSGRKAFVSGLHRCYFLSGAAAGAVVVIVEVIVEDMVD